MTLKVDRLGWVTLIEGGWKIYSKRMSMLHESAGIQVSVGGSG